MRKILRIVTLAGMLASYAAGEVINFDDVDAASADVDLAGVGPYHDHTWSNIFAYTSLGGFPGFNNGIVSPENAAYSGGEVLGAPVVGMITAAAFNFSSGYFGSGYYDNLSIVLNGYFSGGLLFTKTITANTGGAQFYTFDFTNIDKLELYALQTATTKDPFGCGPVNCTQFTFDDLTITPGDSTPEPGTFGLLAAALVTLVFCRPRKFKA